MVEALDQEFGKYHLLERVAAGGMAEVFRAKTSGVGNFEKIVAIKRLHAHYSKDLEFIKMLHDEARIAAVLSHSAIAQIYDFGQVGSHYFIAMEYIDGLSSYALLKKVYANQTNVPIALACYIASEVAGALHHAHTRRYENGRAMEIVHRDISPQNVLLSTEGDVKVVDFGIAKAALRSSTTRSGVIKGKFYYMAPEQAQGEKVDLRCDVFAAGILLYELLTTRPCYDEEDKGVLLEKVKNAEFTPAENYRPDLAPELLSILAKAMAVKPAHRYQSALDFSWDLVRYLKKSGLYPTRLHLHKYLDELSRESLEPQRPAQAAQAVVLSDSAPQENSALAPLSSSSDPHLTPLEPKDEDTQILAKEQEVSAKEPADASTFAASISRMNFRSANRVVYGLSALLALTNFLVWIFP